jgi:hypothetical protein
LCYSFEAIRASVDAARCRRGESIARPKQTSALCREPDFGLATQQRGVAVSSERIADLSERRNASDCAAELLYRQHVILS